MLDLQAFFHVRQILPWQTNKIFIIFFSLHQRCKGQKYAPGKFFLAAPVQELLVGVGDWMRITLPPAATKGRNIRRGVVRLAIKSHITSTQSRASVGFFAPEKAPPKWGRYTVPVGSGSAWQTACFAGRDARLCLHYTTSGAKNRRVYLLT